MTYMLTKYTFDEFLESAGRPSRLAYPSSRRTNKPEWYGATFAEAQRMALEGWPEGRERIAKSLADIEAIGEDRETMTFDVAGSEPDIGRYLAGEPENMLAFLPTDDKRTIRIMACISISARIGTETVFTRGAAVVALADRLERLGHRVEIVLCDSTRPSNGGRMPGGVAKSVTLVQVKASNQPIDIDRLAFLFAHPASQRRLMFSVKEHRTGLDSHQRHPDEIPAEIQATAHIVLPEADSGNAEWRSPAAAARWIDSQLFRFTPAEA